MKKTLLILSLALLSVSVFAQSAAQKKRLLQEQQDSITMANMAARQAAMMKARVDSENGQTQNAQTADQAARQKHINDSIAALNAAIKNAEKQVAERNGANGQNRSAADQAKYDHQQDSIRHAVILERTKAALKARMDSEKGLTKPLMAGITYQLLYIDYSGDNALATATNPTGPTDAVEWSVEKYNGTTAGLHSFMYQGSNGQNYQTQIVVIASVDPSKKFDVYFQSRKINDGEYHKGRVIILDHNRNPWLVKVDYSNEKGIYFNIKPFEKE